MGMRRRGAISGMNPRPIIKLNISEDGRPSLSGGEYVYIIIYIIIYTIIYTIIYIIYQVCHNLHLILGLNCVCTYSPEQVAPVYQAVASAPVRANV